MDHADIPERSLWSAVIKQGLDFLAGGWDELPLSRRAIKTTKGLSALAKAREDLLPKGPPGKEGSAWKHAHKEHLKARQKWFDARRHVADLVMQIHNERAYFFDADSEFLGHAELIGIDVEAVRDRLIAKNLDRTPPKHPNPIAEDEKFQRREPDLQEARLG